MLPQSLIVIAALSGAPGEDASAPGTRQEGEANAPASPQVVLDLPVEIDGVYARDLAVGIGADGKTAFVRADQLTSVLAEHVSDAFLERLALPDADTLLTVAEVSREGLSVAFDPASLVLRVTLPPDVHRTRSVSLTGQVGGRPGDEIEDPPLSIGLNLFAEPRYELTGPDRGIAPMRARAEGFANFGGFSGANLAWRGTYREDAEEPFTLDELVLFHDRFERAVRFAVGTLRPTPPGFYARPPEVLGVGVFRDYAAIRPFANLRPDGGTRFTLDRESVVIVEINGQVEATRRLAAGAYDLSDLPVRPGGNDVVIYTEEGARRTELAVLSTFVDTRLLARGRSLFGLIAGAERLRGDALPTAGEAFVYSGFYERGLTDQFTLGAGFDGRDGEVMGTARGAVGTKFGLLAAEGAVRSGEGGTASAATLRYSWRSNPRAVRGHGVDLQLSGSQAGFGPVATPLLDRFGAPSSLERREATLRYGLRVDRLAVTASATAGRAGDRDQLTGALTAATSLGAYALSVTARARQTDDPFRGSEREESVLFTLSRRLGRDTRLRTSYDSQERRTQVQALRFSGQALGDWNASALVTDDAAGQGFDGSFGLIANRAEIDVNLRAQDTDDRRTASLRTTLGVGLGYADGRLGFGRPFGNGFVVVGTHESLGDRRVTLRRAGDEMARNGRLGPALLPLRGPYRGERSEIEVADLPIGYDIGAAAVVTFAGARAGYAVTVGSGAANTVFATLLTPEGEPMALAVGRLVPAGAGPDAEGGAEFFTNRTGRFVAEGLTAGAYEVRLKPDDRIVGTLTIPEEADGLVRAGEIRMSQP